MVIITHVYNWTDTIKRNLESFRRFGYEVAVLESDTFRGNADVLRRLHECYLRAATGHTHFIYTDAADTYCQRPINEEYFANSLYYSTEKNLYPLKEIKPRYDELFGYEPKDNLSPWCYLNGGNYGGPLDTIIYFFEKYSLHALDANTCAQHAQACAFLSEWEWYREDNVRDKNIFIDTHCEEFQSMAFAEPEDFSVITCDKTNKFCVQGDKYVRNNITGTIPSILHFNGITDQSILKQLQ